jgi:DNA mismatch repair protein MutS
MADDQLTPMLRQYQAIKRDHAEVILLFRLGDFYEMFGEDAKVASKVLDLTLTSREIGKGRRLPMCGVPHHAVDRYLARLIAAGHKAAICDQMEDPGKAKGLVKREVTRILSAGTLVEEHLLDERRANYLASVAVQDGRIGLAAVESSTGEFTTTELTREQLGDELSRIGPAEVVVSPEAAQDAGLMEAVAKSCNCETSTLDGDAFLLETPREVLTKHFSTNSLRGFGCEEMPAAIAAAAGAIRYLQQMQKSAVEQVRALRTYSPSQFMVLDAATRRNLELTASLRDGSRANTLLWVLDDTRTPMGARLLRQWLLAPLLEVAAINARLDGVEGFRGDELLRAQVRDLLTQVRDMERIVARAAAGTAHARDLLGLRDSLRALPEVAEALSRAKTDALNALGAQIDTLPDLLDLLERSIADDPPLGLREGGLIRPGYSADLDELRRAGTEGKEWIASLQEKERRRTGIKSLKVGFNQVFGYYLEVSKSNLGAVPADYIRKQTMTNGERFITPDLKEWEAKVLGAQEKICDLEYELFAGVRAEVAQRAARVQQSAQALAQADVLASFAEVAARNHFVRPEVHEGDSIEIEGGRHPVVELTLTDERFVPNGARLDCTENQLLIITGPNMAGKSTYLRQVALVALMAQVGSFVPADSAKIGLVDRIFTRVGASDDLATGQSTFRVEMNEAANILHNATRRSLIILDEIGRGTSTFDGLSIAWAVAEYIHNSPRMGAKTLYATHYHHLNELADTLPRVKNYRIAVKEEGDRVVFLRKIVPGGTDRSYGIQVARLAGLPHEVIERAKEVLWTLEQSNSVGQIGPKRGESLRVPPPAPVVQLTLFEPVANPLVDELAALDVDGMTPLQALMKLSEIQAKARRQRRSK